MIENNHVKKSIEKIIEIRKEKGISLEAMAANLNLSTAAYHKIEKQETKFTVDRLYEISKVLDVSVAEILGIKVEKYVVQEVGEHGVGHQYNGDIKALYNENTELSKSFIQSLQAEIEFLKGLVSSK